MDFNPQPGDVVTIRTWDDMESEFGLDEFGEIKTPYISILKGMKQFCGHSYIVKRFTIHLNLNLIYCRVLFTISLFTFLSVLLSVILPPYSPSPFLPSLLIPSSSLSPPLKGPPNETIFPN